VTPSARTHAAALIERMYARRGYRYDRNACANESPHRITLGGTQSAHLFATLTVGLDSDDGLLADELYGTELCAFRREGRKLCELTAFAVDPHYSSPRMLTCLFHLAYLYGRMLHRVTDVFIEVNPHHVGFYERLLSFRRVGQERRCPRVNAPAVLLHLNVAPPAV
jgi:hypothetical protein